MRHWGLGLQRIFVQRHNSPTLSLQGLNISFLAAAAISSEDPAKCSWKVRSASYKDSAGNSIADAFEGAGPGLWVTWGGLGQDRAGGTGGGGLCHQHLKTRPSYPTGPRKMRNHRAEPGPAGQLHNCECMSQTMFIAACHSEPTIVYY